jgi:hypothetical protein
VGLPSNTIEGFRNEWSSRFIDPIEIYREGSIGTFNETTLQYDDPLGLAVWAGNGLIRPLQSEDRKLFGERMQSVLGFAVYLPYDASGIKVGDRVEINLPGLPTYDFDLIGKVWVVFHVLVDSYKTRVKLVVKLEEGGGALGDTG